MRSADRVGVMLRKADGDDFAVKILLPIPESPEDIIGFHAQQAVEIIKAVLTSASIHYRRTHDLLELMDLLWKGGLPFPEELDQVDRLTPFAAEFRYDPMPEEPEQPFDREWAADCVRKTKVWAAAILGQ